MKNATDATWIGRYRVVRPLGQGGMGRVYLAEDPDLERQLAIKLLHQETGRGLRDEAKALAALRDPGIVTVFEVGEHEGRDFIAMEYVPGRTLRELIPEYATRRCELLAICAKVALAVAAAHRAGILHRDIKPENIIVADDGDVKVVDFGIARREIEDPPSGATMTDLVDAYVRTLPPEFGETMKSASGATITGTPSYMAPELLYGESSSVASDTYSLGVVLYECLTGRRPHSGRSLVELITNIVESPVARLDDPLGELVARMLEPEPVQRISVEEVAARLAPKVRLPRRLVAGISVGAVMSIVLASYIALAQPEPPTATVAVAVQSQLVNTFGNGYGNTNPDTEVIAQTIVRYFDSVDGVHITGIPLKGPDVVEPRANATHYLHGRIGHTPDGRFHAVFQLDDLSGRRLLFQTIDTRDPNVGALIQTVARRAAEMIDSRAVLNLDAQRLHARRVLEQAKTLVVEARYDQALPLLDDVIAADPHLAEAWYYLALTRTWLLQAEPLVKATIDQAVELEQPGDRRDFLVGVQHYFHHRFREARDSLEQLLQRIPPKSPSAAFVARDLYYFLGEANWHDGRHQAGYELFMRAIEIDRRFHAATVHIAQYCVARRDPCAAYALGLQHEPLDALEFSLGKYEEVARRTTTYGREARIVLGTDLTEAEIDKKGDIADAHRIARAFANGDDAGARRLFEAIHQTLITKHPNETAFIAIDHLSEVLLSAGMVDESRKMAAFLAGDGPSNRKRSYERFAILTAALTGERAWIPKGLTERDTALAGAVLALLDGDADRGIAGLAKLVADPTAAWEFPERALLVRTLRGRGRVAEADAVCADSLRPAFFRIAVVAMRRVCK